MPEMLTPHGISIEYDVHGDGSPLILIGGLGFGRWSWFKQVPALSNHFRTITFDVRGEQSLSARRRRPERGGGDATRPPRHREGLRPGHFARRLRGPGARAGETGPGGQAGAGLHELR